ncbi:MAG: S8 family serine peptidase [Leptolinea sp.]
MIEPAQISVSTQNSNKQENQGCSGLAAMILLSIWIIAASFIAQIVNWSLVQAIFEGSLRITDLRWLVLLLYALLLLIPLLIAYKVVRNPVYRARFKSLALISTLAFLLSISRTAGITNWQLAVTNQLAVTIPFLLIFWLVQRKENSGTEPEQKPALSMILLSAAAGGFLGMPWVLLGAQGSFLDTILATMSAAAFGAVIAAVLVTSADASPLNGQPDGKKRGVAGMGWTITLGLIILTVAADQNGNGWVLAAAVLPLGFACAALSMRMDGSISKAGRAAAGVLAALGLAWPMIMIDPDELSFVISSGSGELLEDVSIAAGIAFAIALMVMAVFLLVRNWYHTSNIKINVSASIFLQIWVAILVVYFFIGQPGFFGEKTFVILKSQADLSSERAITDPIIRRNAVYQSLVKNANSSQKELRTWLNSKNISYKSYYLVNAVELEADPILRGQLAVRSDVDRVLDSPILRPLSGKIPVANGLGLQPKGSEWNLKMIGAEAVHSELNIRGEGIIVGQSDSGAQGDHPEFAARYRGVIEGNDDYNWLDPWFASKSPVDIGGHGTHTLGSILGEKVGVAPKAEWIGCVNLARNLGNPALYLDCMQFMLAPFPQNGDPFLDGKPVKGANVLNNSWGCPDVEGCDPGTYLPAVKALRDAGVFVVASAGNSGYGGCSTVQDPLAIYEDVYTVGAIDETGNLADFSSLGPVEVDGSGRVKPDIVAPGVDILSSFPGSTYEMNSGTSMAGPHVVGVVALMWSANPNLIGDIDRTREILNQTADPYSGRIPDCAQNNGKPDNAAGYGVVNAYKAVQQALADRKNNQ